jgi:hypothetical protein
MVAPSFVGSEKKPSPADATTDVLLLLVAPPITTIF